MNKLTITLVCLLVAGTIQAQLTALDTTFNHTGYVVHKSNVANVPNFAPKDFAVQSTGDIITTVTDYPTTYFRRFKENGELDSSFKLMYNTLQGLHEYTIDIIVLKDDRFWIFARNYSDSLALHRFLPDGTPDSSFGINGQQNYRFQPYPFSVQFADCFARQADGKIIMCSQWTGVRQLIRADSTGKVDSSFGVNGIVWLPASYGQNFTVTKILFQTNRILCTGLYDDGGIDKYAVHAFKYNGVTDSSFGTNGLATIDVGPDALIRSSHLQIDEKIILGGGNGTNGNSGDVVIVRLKANGTPDSTFGIRGDGIVITDLFDTSSDRTGGVDIDANGVIWATALGWDKAGDISTMLVRYTKDGIVDSLYPTNGRIPFVLNPYLKYERTCIVKDKLFIYGNGSWASWKPSEFVARIFLRPILNIQDDTTACTGDTVLLTCENHLPHKWYHNDTLLSYTGTTLKTVNPGTYKVVLNDGAASDSSQTIKLDFKPRPAKPVLTGDTMLCEGDTLSINASSSTVGVTWNWIKPVGTFTNISADTIIDSALVTDGGLYRAAAALDGCISEEDSLLVTVHPVVIPSVSATSDKGFNPGPWVSVLFSATNVMNGGNAPAYQWAKNGTDIPGANNSTHSLMTTTQIQQGDVICVKLTSNEVCARPATVSSCITVNIDLGINKSRTEERLNIYPNPSTGTLNINTTGNMAWQLVSMQGQIIMTGTFHAGVNTIEIPDYIANGTYLLQVEQSMQQIVLER